METRLAVMADAPALAGLHGESFGAAAWSLKQIADSLDLPTVQSWVVADKDVAQGFIMLQSALDEAEILTFCVSPQARHKGAGTLLLEMALRAAREASLKRIYLEVASDNMIALSLYEKLGFQVIGRRADYYKRGSQTIDAVTYSLDLK